MPNMFSGENFPYTNFHDLNLDWIIKIAKDFLDQYTHIQDMIDQGKIDIQNETESSLETIQEKADEITGLLNQWYNEHSEDIAGVLADALEDLTEALAAAVGSFNTQATNIVNTLIESIPADYTGVTRLASEHKSDLLYLNAYNVIDDVTKTGRTIYDVTFTFNYDKCTVQGTATGGNAFVNIFADTAHLPPNISAGDIVYPGLIKTASAVTYMEIYSYDAMEAGTLIYSSKASYNYDYLVIPSDAVGMTIRLVVDSGDTANEVVYPYLSKEPTQQVLEARTFRDYAGGNCVFLRALSSSADRTYEINRLLTAYKHVVLLEGDFYAAGTINIPAGGSLKGLGAKTSRIISTYTSGSCINMADDSTVANLSIVGPQTSMVTVIGSHNAISVYQIDEPVYIENCIIEGFDRAGISINGKGGGTEPYFINNCMIQNSYYGLWIHESEYIQITSVSCRFCYVGTWDNGGNNKYCNCGFDHCNTGVQMTTSYSNNAHGSFVGCSINHSTTNAIVLANVSNGEIFDGCQIHFGAVVISGTTRGVNFIGCQFGNSVEITYSSTNQNYINHCEFWTLS